MKDRVVLSRKQALELLKSLAIKFDKENVKVSRSGDISIEYVEPSDMQIESSDDTKLFKEKLKKQLYTMGYNALVIGGRNSWHDIVITLHKRDFEAEWKIINRQAEIDADNTTVQRLNEALLGTHGPNGSTIWISALDYASYRWNIEKLNQVYAFYLDTPSGEKRILCYASYAWNDRDETDKLKNTPITLVTDSGDGSYLGDVHTVSRYTRLVVRPYTPSLPLQAAYQWEIETSNDQISGGRIEIPVVLSERSECRIMIYFTRDRQWDADVLYRDKPVEYTWRVEVNWPAIGSTPPADTRNFANALREAAELAALLENKLADLELKRRESVNL